MNTAKDGLDWARVGIKTQRVPNTQVVEEAHDAAAEAVKGEWAALFCVTDPEDERSPRERLAVLYGDCREAVIAESKRRRAETAEVAAAYDADQYVWKSDGRVGNTLTEIEEIRVTGAPYETAETELGAFFYRDYDAQGYTEHRLKSSEKAYKKGWFKDPSPCTPDTPDALQFLYSESPAVQEEYLIRGGAEEVMHSNHGRGFLLDVDETAELVKVYFMQLRGRTPSCQHGANIKWVKRSNLL